MVSTVKPRPSHYEVLGLKPGASAAEIEQAFARSMSVFRPRALGGVAQVGMAYEVLRDAASRRAYDASIGVGREEKPGPFAAGWTVGPQFIGVPAPLVPRKPPLPAEGRVGSFIAGSMRDAVEAQPAPPPPAAPAILREAAEVRPRPAVEPRPALSLGQLSPADEAPIAWKRPAIAVAGVVAVVAFAGAMAGVSLGGDVEASQQPGRAVTLALPRAKPATAPAEPYTAAISPVVAGPRERHSVRVRTARAPQAPAAEADSSDASTPPPAQSVALDSAVDSSPPPSTLVETAAASLPLSKNVIARTIGRIGYACGEVASARPSAGEAGVFNVTCTSGDSYRAAPVRGRYRFHRLGGH
jgi:hypothetical protein